jgi:hypothetical protein
LVEEVLLVQSHKANRVLIGIGGTKAWRLNPQRVLKCKYVVVCRLATPMDEETQSDPHRAAYLVGKVRDVIPAPGEPGRWFVRFSDYSEVLIPNIFPGQRSPVAYKTIDDLQNLGLDPSALLFQPVPTQEKVVRRPPMEEAVAAAAGILGVPVSRVTITITA